MAMTNDARDSVHVERPTTLEDLTACIADANHARRTLEIVGGRTKRSLGNPVNADAVLDLSAFSGVEFYEPEELVIKVRAGTRLADLRAILAERRQHLGFEPPSYGGLFGAQADADTVGGVIACNLSGPRRVLAGSARDAVLGIEGVNGAGVAFKGGGRTVKNVTGYDLPRLMTGSFGVLAALTSVTLKVHPMPEFESTLLIEGVADARAMELASTLLRSPIELGAASHISGRLNAPSLTAFRLEGFRESVVARGQQVMQILAGEVPITLLEDGESRAFWVRQRDLADLMVDEQTCLWRLALPAHLAAGVVGRLGSEAIYGWGGAEVFVKMSVGKARNSAADLRATFAAVGGFATLFRAPDDLRMAVGVFQPKQRALAGLTNRVRQAFDPAGILNPGKIDPIANGEIRSAN
jgi:glycolate oxidase FAD binding subunit